MASARSHDDESGLPSAIRWSGISMVARELSRTAFTIAIARLIGPTNFGIVAQATVFIAIVTILLDQGFSSALIQRKKIEPEMPGAVVSANIAIGGAVGVLTIAIAPLWASFMHSPPLTLVLAAFSPALIFRSLAITPRAMLMREMKFRKIGIADAVAAAASGLLGLVIALIWHSYWAIVVQVVSLDALTLLILLCMGAGHRPNLHYRQLRKILGFSVRVFAAGFLFGAISRNIDNLLIGWFQGPQALAFYALAYRLLLLPTQVGGTTIGQVLFPLLTRFADEKAAMTAEITRTTRALAMLSLPVMALVAAAAPQLVSVLFGSQWKPAIPIVQVLALVGAMQAIYRPSTGPLLMAVGRPDLMLRWAWLSTIVIVVGISAGLPFGPFGVAVGYTVASGFLVPMQWLIRKHILGMTFGPQLAALAPPCHVAAWVVVSYIAVSVNIPGGALLMLVAGVSSATLVGIAVLYIAHRNTFTELINMANRVIGRHGG